MESYTLDIANIVVNSVQLVAIGWLLAVQQRPRPPRDGFGS